MSVRVKAQINPFSPEITEFEAESGQSIAEIIRKIDPHKAVNTGWRVLIDDRIVTDFTEIPGENRTVYVKLVPEGDNREQGAAMKIGGAALTALGVVVSIWCAPLGLAVAGVGVGLFAGGMVLYNTDISASSRESPEQDPSIRGSQNQTRPKGYIPILFGRRRIYPDSVVSPFTWVDPDTQEQYLYQLLCCGQKDQTIETDTIKIGETLLADYSGGDIDAILSGKDDLIQMEISQGTDTPPLVTKCVHEEQINASLVKEDDDGIAGDIVRTTPDGTEEINVDIFFPSGLGKYDDDGNLVETSVRVEAYYKKKDADDDDYELLGYFNPSKTTTTTQTYSQVFTVGMGMWSEKQAWKLFENWVRVSGDNFTVNLSEKSKYTLSFNNWVSVYGKYLAKFTVSYSVTTSTTAGTNTLDGNELKTKRYAITKSGLAAAAYTVKVVRVTDDSDDSKIVDSVYLGSIRAVKNVPPVSKAKCQALTLIGLKIKATGKLNGIVNELNFISQSKAPLYDGNGNGANSWTQTALTSNPASMAVLAMQGKMAQQKLSDSDIDWDSFAALYEWCEEYGYECNAYVSDSVTIQNLLSQIGSTCRAEIARINGKITVIHDIERDSFVQMFSPRNSHDYSEQIAFSDIPDRLAIPFVNEDAGFAEDECYVFNTDDGNESSDGFETSQDLTLWGVTNSRQARKLGLYNYAVTKARPLVHKFSTDIEYMLCRKGDWIKYAGDIALAGLKQGRITGLVYKNSKIAGVQTDEELTMESGKSYALRIRKSDGTAELLTLEGGNGTFTSVNFATLQDTSLGIAEGDLFFFGTVGNDSIDLIVTDIICGEDLTAELTCVEYAPEIFGVDSDDFILPEFQSKISDAQGAVDDGVYTKLKIELSSDVEKLISNLNPKSINPRGDWQKNVVYYVNDAVYYAETKTSYLCIKQHTSGADITPENTEYWQVLAAQGEQGATELAGDFSFFNVYFDCDHTTFGCDEYNKVEKTAYFATIHVTSGTLELPFTLNLKAATIGKGDSKVTGTYSLTDTGYQTVTFADAGIILTEFENNSYHGVKIETVRGSNAKVDGIAVEDGEIDIPVVYSEDPDIYIYGKDDDNDGYGFGQNEGATAVYGCIVMDASNSTTQTLTFTYSVTDLSQYRGTMSAIEGFLEPDPEDRGGIVLHTGDWFTWVAVVQTDSDGNKTVTNDKVTATYNGTTVTFRVGYTYRWNGDYWERDTGADHLTAAFKDMLASNADLLEQNEDNTVNEWLNILVSNQIFTDKLTANEAFIDKVFSNTVRISSYTDRDGNFHEGVLYGGGYNSSGKWEGTVGGETYGGGFYFDADGTAKIRGELLLEDGTSVDDTIKAKTYTVYYPASAAAAPAQPTKNITTSTVTVGAWTTTDLKNSTAYKYIYASVITTSNSGTFLYSTTPTLAACNVNISKTDVYYNVSTSGSTAPETPDGTSYYGWSTSTPTVPAGSYLWSLPYYKLADGTDMWGTAVCISKSKAIVKAVEYYFLSDSSTSAPADSVAWQTAQPAWKTGKYIWSCTYLEYADGTKEYANKTLMSVISNVYNSSIASKYTVYFKTKLFTTSNGKTIYNTSGKPKAPTGNITENTEDADVWTKAELKRSSTYPHVFTSEIFNNANGTFMGATEPEAIHSTLLTSDGQIYTNLIDVDDLFAQNITLKEKGVISSKNYGGTIDTTNGKITAFNTNASKTGWAIDYSGQADFTNINATGGTFKDINLTGSIIAENLGIKSYVFLPGFSTVGTYNDGVNKISINLETIDGETLDGYLSAIMSSSHAIYADSTFGTLKVYMLIYQNDDLALFSGKKRSVFGNYLLSYTNLTTDGLYRYYKIGNTSSSVERLILTRFYSFSTFTFTYTVSPDTTGSLSNNIFLGAYTKNVEITAENVHSSGILSSQLGYEFGDGVGSSYKVNTYGALYSFCYYINLGTNPRVCCFKKQVKDDYTEGQTITSGTATYTLDNRIDLGIIFKRNGSYYLSVDGTEYEAEKGSDTSLIGSYTMTYTASHYGGSSTYTFTIDLSVYYDFYILL